MKNKWPKRAPALLAAVGFDGVDVSYRSARA